MRGRHRVAGLEISANRLRVVEQPSSGPIRTGEIDLPEGAVGDGQILSATEATAAIRELWTAASIGTHDVMVGLSNQDIVSRQIDMPALEDRDLESALRFELADMIPFPMDDAILQFRRIEDHVDQRGVPHTRVLAVAALRSTLAAHLDILRDAGLRVRGVDLTPLALVRAVAADEASSGARAEGATEAIVAVTQDGLSVVVHTDGVARFTRTIATQLGSSLAGELEAELVLVEQYRQRAVGDSGGAPTFDRLDPVVEAIRGTLEYASIQPGSPTIDRVVVCGDQTLAATTAGLAEVLRVPVVFADPLAAASAADGVTPLLTGVSSRFTAAFGLTLDSQGGPSGPAPLDLLPGRQESTGAGPLVRRAAASAGVTAALLAALTMAAGPDVGSAEQALGEARTGVELAQSRLHAASADRHDSIETAALGTRAARVAAIQVDWARLDAAILAAAPAGSSVVSINGDGPTKSKTGKRSQGSIRIVASAASQTAISQWLDNLSRVPGLARPWLGSSTGSGDASSQTTFTLTAEVTDAANRVTIPPASGPTGGSPTS